MPLRISRFLRQFGGEAYGNVSVTAEPWPFFIFYWT